MDDIENVMRVDTLPRNGSCTGCDPRIWFPNASRSNPGKFSQQFQRATENERIAKQICSTCHIKTDCLNYAVYHEGHGIWGGKNERERAAIRKHLGIEMVEKGPTIIIYPTDRNKVTS
jgi:hypothetical protein